MSQPEYKNVRKGVKNVFAEFIRQEGGGYPELQTCFPKEKNC